MRESEVSCLFCSYLNLPGNVCFVFLPYQSTMWAAAAHSAKLLELHNPAEPTKGRLSAIARRSETSWLAESFCQDFGWCYFYYFVAQLLLTEMIQQPLLEL